MITAIRLSDQKKVLARDIEKNPSESYICDYCEKQVIHNKSFPEIRGAHFKHKPNESDCPNQGTGESAYHWDSKYDIHNYIKTEWGHKLKIIEVEKWLLNKTARADVYIETQKSKIAIEVQATILSIQELRRRTKQYSENDIYVLWILPFEKNRLYTYRLNRENEFEWIRNEKVKLKEMEVFLYWAYDQKLLFWDLKHEDYDDFISDFFDEYKTEDTEYGYGKKLKTTKEFNGLRKISFKEMTTKEFPHSIADNRPYSIPSRKLFTFDALSLKRNSK